MAIHCYTSFTFGYLSRARLLADTIRRHHPDWVIWAVITDEIPPDYDDANEPFDKIVYTKDLFEDLGPAWIFAHTIVEVCTAVKGRALQKILNEPDVDSVVYFDPDIAVFSPLTSVVSALDESSIVLTPHQIDPEDDAEAIRDNEIASLHYGTFNLGFLAVRNDTTGHLLADWWARRLETYCLDRLEIGLFVDQKWFNLVPGFFDSVKVLRDPGLNVASWNISKRDLKISTDGSITVNGSPLGFYHFTKIGGPGDTMTERYARGRSDILEIWAWYRLAIAKREDLRIPDGWWAYGAFEDGTKITDDMRRVYGERSDLRAHFENPFRTGDEGYAAWFENEAHS